MSNWRRWFTSPNNNFMGQAKEKQKLMDDLLVEVKRWEEPVGFQLHLVDAVNLCAWLRLSLTYPDAAKRPSAQMVLGFIQSFYNSLPPEFPALREVIKAGYFFDFVQPKPDPNRKCRVCGCTEDRACPGGCSWVEKDLCSACAPAAHSIITP